MMVVTGGRRGDIIYDTEVDFRLTELDLNHTHLNT